MSHLDLALRIMALALWGIFLVVSPALQDGTAMAQDRVVPSEQIELPPPSTLHGIGLEEALSHRRSIRSFTPGSVSLQAVSQLLWAAQGNSGSGRRTAPSAGATYPFEIYLVVERVDGLEPGLYHYRIGEHRLELVRAGHLAAPLAATALGQGCVRDAPLSLVLVAWLERIEPRYGDRSLRYIYMEGGAIAENVALSLVGLDLGGVLAGAFDDEGLQAFLGIDALPVAILPVGPVEQVTTDPMEPSSRTPAFGP